MSVEILTGDCRDVLPTLPEKSVHCCVTSPPYWGLRDYGLKPIDWPGEYYWEDDKTQVEICAPWCGSYGLEPTPEMYVHHTVQVFREVWRVLRDDGTLWLNLGDTYGTGTRADRRPGNKLFGDNTALAQGISRHGGMAKQLIGIPWRVALALQADGWYLRSDIIWHKPTAMPESVKDRPTKAHEYIFLLSKSIRYYYDHEAIKEPASPDTHARYARGRSNTHKNAGGGPGNQTIAKSFDHMRKPGVNPKAAMNAKGSKQNSSFSAAVCDIVGERNKRTVWTIPAQSYPGSHFATFPEKLIEPCILAGCPEGGTVLDPFGGSGTTGRVAIQHRRKAILIELNPEYIELQKKRTSSVPVKMF